MALNVVVKLLLLLFFNQLYFKRFSYGTFVSERVKL